MRPPRSCARIAARDARVRLLAAPPLADGLDRQGPCLPPPRRRRRAARICCSSTPTCASAPDAAARAGRPRRRRRGAALVSAVPRQVMRLARRVARPCRRSTCCCSAICRWRAMRSSPATRARRRLRPAGAGRDARPTAAAGGHARDPRLPARRHSARPALPPQRLPDGLGAGAPPRLLPHVSRLRRGLGGLRQERARGHGDAARPAGLDACSWRRRTSLPLVLLLAGRRPCRRPRRRCCCRCRPRRRHLAARESLVAVPLHPLTVLVAPGDPVGALVRCGMRPAGGLEGPRLSGRDDGMSAAPRGAGDRPDHETRISRSPRSLLAPAIASAVLAFYRFVRIADDIADAPGPGAGREAPPPRRPGGGAAPRRPGRAAGGRGSRRSTAARGRCREARLLLPPSARTRKAPAMPTGTSSSTTAASPPIPVGRFLLRLHGEGDERAAAPPTRSAPRCRS